MSAAESKSQVNELQISLQQLREVVALILQQRRALGDSVALPATDLLTLRETVKLWRNLKDRGVHCRVTITGESEVIQ